MPTSRAASTACGRLSLRAAGPAPPAICHATERSGFFRGALIAFLICFPTASATGGGNALPTCR